MVGIVYVAGRAFGHVFLNPTSLMSFCTHAAS